MPDKGVTSNGRTFGEGTKLTLNVKTIVWILGILVLVFGYFYVDMRIKLKEANACIEDLVHKEMMDYDNDVNEMKGDIKSVEQTVNQNAVNIGILLDRTSGNRESGTSDLSPEENVPTEINRGN